MTTKTTSPTHLVILAITVCVLIWSAIVPVDFFEWAIQAVLITAVIIFFVATYRTFTFTTLAYLLIATQIIGILIAAHYTYTHAPIMNWVNLLIDSDRNYTDRLNHFLQGVAGVIVIKELLIRLANLKPTRWLMVGAIMLTLAIAALFELFEFVISATTSFDLATGQGDPYDTQKDMLMAFIGAIITLTLLSHIHNKQIQHQKQSSSSSIQ
jgi:putative membrane protein